MARWMGKENGSAVMAMKCTAVVLKIIKERVSAFWFLTDHHLFIVDVSL